MKRLFVDSSALIALADTNDDSHETSRDFLLTLEKGISFLTTDFILDETATRLRIPLGAQKAATVCRKIIESHLYKIVFADKRLLLAGLQKMEKFADKKLSLTDCVSFALMEKRKIQTAFTFDDDFKKVGFQMVP